MYKSGIRYWVLWLFLLGILIIVFLQVVSSYNIKRLIQGNNRLLHELQIQNDLRHLESNILTVENDILSFLASGDRSSFSKAEKKFEVITKELDQLNTAFRTQVPENEIKKLSLLVEEKIQFSKSIPNVFATYGRDSADQAIHSGHGQILNDSILSILTMLDSIRQAKLREITASNETSGARARLWGIVITTIALVTVVLAFWYVLNHGRQQQKIIALLNESDKRNREIATLKEQFLANMSHEIRTPMNSILGFTNLIKRTTLNEEQKTYVQNINSSCENLLALVNDILDLSKIEAGMMQLEEVRFSLQSLITSVGAMFTEKIKRKKLHFNVNVDPSIPDILQGDAVRLTQILVNLLSNAVKFTPKGDISLQVHLLENTGAHVRIQIDVTDTGIGIAPENLKNIFERFQQAEAETTRRFGGSGLGLAIVRQLVALQGGSVQVKSELHKGTQFTVLMNYKLPDTEQLFSEAVSTETEPVSLKKIRVLIAEDNLMNQQLMAHLMKDWDIPFTIVNNGIEVIEVLEKEKYTMVLMDIQMPEMDGYTATGVIRNKLHLSIPVIAMTAHAMAGEKENCLQMGMNDYVSKPIKETILYNVIAKHAPHTESNDDTHINLEYLHELSGNDSEFEKQILQQFIIQCAEELTHLEHAIEQKNFDKIRSIAHSMKSTIGYVGLASELNPFFDRIEKNAEAGIMGEMLEDFRYVEKKCIASSEDVKKILHGL